MVVLFLMKAAALCRASNNILNLTVCMCHVYHLHNPNLSDVFVSELSLFSKKREWYFNDDSNRSNNTHPTQQLDGPLALKELEGGNTCTSIFLEPTHHCLNGWKKNTPGMYVYSSARGANKTFLLSIFLV